MVDHCEKRWREDTEGLADQQPDSEPCTLLWCVGENKRTLNLRIDPCGFSWNFLSNPRHARLYCQRETAMPRTTFGLMSRVLVPTLSLPSPWKRLGLPTHQARTVWCRILPFSPPESQTDTLPQQAAAAPYHGELTETMTKSVYSANHSEGRLPLHMPRLTKQAAREKAEQSKISS